MGARPALKVLSVTPVFFCRYFDLFTTPNILTLDCYKQLYEHSLLLSLISGFLLKVAWSRFGFRTLLLIRVFLIYGVVSLNLGTTLQRIQYYET